MGGSVQFPKGYIKSAAALVRKNGGLFVSDEVQSGFGRTGDHYWGFEGHDIVPDIVTMAKGMEIEIMRLFCTKIINFSRHW